MKYRSRAHIIAALIQVAAKEGATPTRLRYEAGLSALQINEYLPFMLRKGLLFYDGATQRYHITDKARKFMHCMVEINKALGFEYDEAWANI